MDRVSWYPDSAASKATIDFPQFDSRYHGGFAIVGQVYNHGGHAVTDEIRFVFMPMPNVQSAARGTITLTERNGGEIYWRRRDQKYEYMSDFNMFDGSNTANYGILACNFQLQSRNPGGTLVDRIEFTKPQVWRTQRDVRWDLELEIANF